MASTELSIPFISNVEFFVMKLQRINNVDKKSAKKRATPMPVKAFISPRLKNPCTRPESLCDLLIKNRSNSPSLYSMFTFLLSLFIVFNSSYLEVISSSVIGHELRHFRLQTSHILGHLFTTGRVSRH